MLCVSLASPDREGLARRLAEVEDAADMVEIRLDHVAPSELEGVFGLISRCRIPVIATNRSVEQGGRFKGGIPETLEILKAAVEAGADFVDIELETMEKVAHPLTHLCRSEGCRLIISHHDFHGTPRQEELRESLRRIAWLGPNVAKLVTTARTPEDVRCVLSVYCIGDLLPFDLVAFSMGPVGTMSRLACLALGAPFTYVAYSREELTAPGQLDLETARRVVELTGGEIPKIGLQLP